MKKPQPENKLIRVLKQQETQEIKIIGVNADEHMTRIYAVAGPASFFFPATETRDRHVRF
ncbi:MAG: hypothetical protein FD123_2114 [Bacteroidetes bacterium]|nr:MAG: hypothetical protein FD123_2114 [Bacteroidota bacterium]